jgi:hypothetical protein
MVGNSNSGRPSKQELLDRFEREVERKFFGRKPTKTGDTAFDIERLWQDINGWKYQKKDSEDEELETDAQHG